MMTMTKEQRYKAIMSKDARFDGVFFTAVKTTGIYCRPICKVPAPKEENCTFYDTAIEAESNGYRPCLRCRPEMAPEYSEFVQGHELLGELIHYFDENNYKTGIVNEASDAFGITTRHIHRIFKEALGVSPKAYIMTKRLLKAKGLLTDTGLSVLDISDMVGFGSVSRFNAAIKKHYGLTPTDIRKKSFTKQKDALEVKLSYRPPYNWDQMTNFFRMRTIEGVDMVTDSGSYIRTLKINDSIGWIGVKPQVSENRVILRISNSLEKEILEVIKRVRVVFDLDAAPDLMGDDFLKGVRLPGSFDGFEMSVRAVLGQQITVKAAKTLTKRLVETLGEHVETPWLELNKVFPDVESIINLKQPVEEVLGPLGIIRNRSRLIKVIAESFYSGELDLSHGMNPDLVKNQLLSLKGLGPWTAEYLLMRGLSWSDAFPVSDIGVKNAIMESLSFEGQPLLSYKEIFSKYKFNKLYEKLALEYAESYRPWRSYLTIALWDSLKE